MDQKFNSPIPAIKMNNVVALNRNDARGEKKLQLEVDDVDVVLWDELRWNQNSPAVPHKAGNAGEQQSPVIKNEESKKKVTT